MNRVLVIGLDGATFDVIHLLAEQGRLPNLMRLMEKGVWGELRSTMPPITPTAWTSFFTGKNPGKHGIYDFQELDPLTYQFRPVRADRHEEKTVWQLLTEAGLTSVVIDVPFTYPPTPIEGIMITGYGTPRTSGTVCSYPANLANMLPENLRDEVRVALPDCRFDRSRAFVEEWRAVMNGRSRLLRHLLQNYPWHFFMTVFTITDNMAHVFWTYVEPTHPNYHKPEAAEFREAFYGAYEQCDQLVGEMLELVDSDTAVLIMSDHGFGSVRPRQYIFQRLLDGGYLRYQNKGKWHFGRDWLIKTAVRTYNQFPILRETVKRLRPRQQNRLKQTLRHSGLLPSGELLDPARSRIIPSNYGLQMWVNDNGRFAHGLVSPAQRESLLTDLTSYLLADRDKITNSPIISAVYRSEDLYQGPASIYGPDLVIDYANFYQPQHPAKTLNPFLEGGHTPNGIFIGYGKPFQQGQLTQAHLIDLAPTILHLLAQPIPPDMDGHVLAEALQPDYLTQHPVRIGDKPAHWAEGKRPLSSASFTPEEEADFKNQLKQLGYL
ncbi:MAG: hypothetical protein D6706_15605 [Chloroflexi bacterium]|nr:MAG: hypothetical protein D6706_15605 [Chloroflexota bacterium]